MPASLYSDIERIMQSQSFVWLSQLESKYGVEIFVYRPIGNTFSTVYGRESGDDSVESVASLKVLLVGDDFVPVDISSAGTFKEGWLYSSDSVVNVGDLISLEREDTKSRRYKVTDLETLGTTRVVFKKFRVSALAD